MRFALARLRLGWQWSLILRPCAFSGESLGPAEQTPLVCRMLRTGAQNAAVDPADDYAYLALVELEVVSPIEIERDQVTWAQVLR